MVLIVDDYPDLRRVLALLLKGEGYEVAEAGSAREALAVMDARVPHCVLLDGHMPEVNGITLLRQIRAEPRYADVRVIFFSADGALREPAIEAGAVAFVEKASLDFGALSRELDRHCKAARPKPARLDVDRPGRRIG